MNNLTYFKPKNFPTKELVTKNLFKLASQYGNQRDDFLLARFDPKLLYSIQKIREYYKKPIIINNWSNGGKLQNRGLRDINSRIGAKYSQHKLGNALDFNIIGVPDQEVRNHIIKNPDLEVYKYITGIEDFKDMSWVHIDTRNWNKEKYGLYIFNG